MISEKIVVVDDDPRVHQSLKAILSDYQLVSFLDARKGLEYLLAPNEIKLALVDVCMKELNGVELLESIRRAKKEIAVIIMTAHGSQDIVVESLRLHADDYIEKPFDIHELRDRVKMILKEKSRYDSLARDPHTQMERIRRADKPSVRTAPVDGACFRGRWPSPRATAGAGSPRRRPRHDLLLLAVRLPKSVAGRVLRLVAGPVLRAL